jgi:membrane protease YdiL (CAAX protease family)
LPARAEEQAVRPREGVSPEAPLHRLFFNEQRLRAGWRIAVFFGLFLVFSVVGQIAVGFLPAATLRWASILAALAAALAAGWIVLARLDGRPIGALGFAWTRRSGREIAWGTALGGALILGAALLLFLSRAAYFIPDSGTVGGYVATLFSTFCFFAIAAAWEEALFRGYPFQALVEGIGAWPATIFASALFSAMHGWNPGIDWVALINIFLAGVMLSLAYLRTRSLWFATAVHTGWNWTMATLLDFPVSGLVFDTPLYGVRELGPAWWTGGGFGPEAGLAGTIVLLVAIVWMTRTPRLAPAPELLRLGPIVERRLGPPAEATAPEWSSVA